MKLGSRILLVLGIGFLEMQAAAQVIETHTFGGLNRSIPDGNWSGLSDVRTIASSVARVDGVRVRLQVAGEFNGDLYCYLRHISATATNFCVLLNRPGRSTDSALGYDDAGLNVVFDDLAFAGNIHTYRTVTNPPPGTSLQGAWQPDGRVSDPATVLDSDLIQTALGSFKGTDASGTWTLFVADVDKGATNMLVGWELELTGAASPPIVWPTPADITYGSTLSAVQLNASAGTVSGSFVYQPAVGTVLTAGTHTLQAIFTPTETATYLAATTSVSINVLPKDLVITANDVTRQYDGTVFSGGNGVTYQGFVNGETSAVLSGLLTYGGTSQGAMNAGAYSITPGGLTSANYAISFVDGTLTIAKAASAGLVAVSANPARPGEPVTFTVSLSAVAPGAGIPSGLVQVVIGPAPAGDPAVLAGGVASCTVSNLTAGTYTVSAEYAGDVNFFGTTNSLTSTLLVNGAPVAQPDTIVRYATNEVKVAIATLLNNDSDPEGDTFSFVNASATGTNGGIVTREGDWIRYTPPPGSSDSDAFSYFITDGHGAAVAGTVLVQAIADPLPSPNLSISELGNGSFLIEFSGIPGLRYRVEFCEDLAAPSWTHLGDAVVVAPGLFRFEDTPPQGAALRYYRSAFP